ncbi:MAG: N-acetylmuramoyl-L-alanine amidase [Betaproteobacteria bacterium]|nr:N-acetylmuramoyl-L-alanine amidase [Betaproteobacteria bacterium]
MNRLLLSLFLLPALIAAPVCAAEVAIDVGHGRLDGGAISARGRSEFDFNRQFAEILAAALAQRGLAVRRINFAGDIGSLAERPRQALGADFFLSVHHDSIGEAYLQRWEQDGQEMTYTEAKRGFGLFVAAGNPDPASSLRCASAIGAVLRRNGFQPSSWHGRTYLAADADNGVWYYDNLVVLYRASQPAVLFEAGVIKHREEELQLLDPQRQARMADALATGIAACLMPTEKPARD